MKQKRFFVVHMKDSICKKILSLRAEQWKCLLTILIKRCSS